MTPAILGVAGTTVTAQERAAFAGVDPAGYILFAHNVVDAEQVRALTDDLRAVSGRDDLAILVDQEGGPVARLKPPEFPAFPAGAAFDALYERAPMSAIAAARANGVAVGALLAALGITVNCAPLLDRRHTGATPAVATRTFGGDARAVAALGRAMLDGMAEAGVVGVVKHMPGHGRATVDSHHGLPRVTADAAALDGDIAPFRTLAPHAAMGMTCHVVFDAWDADAPATVSARVIRDVVRGAIGFDGWLMSDDIAMAALSGTAPERAAAAVAAGCDVALDCWSRGDGVRALADALPPMTDAGRARLGAAMASVVRGGAVDAAGAAADRDALLALA